MLHRRIGALVGSVVLALGASGAARGATIMFTTDGMFEGVVSGPLGAGTGQIFYLGKDASGVSTWRVDGDLVIADGDVVTVLGGGPVRIIVGNNVIASGGAFDVSGLGGDGGGAGTGGAGAPISGNGAVLGYPGVGSFYYDFNGSDGGAGGVGEIGGTGSAGSEGDSGAAGFLSGSPGSGGAGGMGGSLGAAGLGGMGGAGGLGGADGGNCGFCPPEPEPGQNGNAGLDGHPGGAGGPGGPGRGGDGGQGVFAFDGDILREGAGGGGGGGPGGGGSGGSGGGGGGGGGGGTGGEDLGSGPELIDPDSPGGLGGDGGSGGVPGWGGAGESAEHLRGGAGGNGGGAIEVIANGRLIVGNVTAAGESGAAGDAELFSAGGAPGHAGFPGLSGANGQQGAANGNTHGAVGGDGGSGGTGGAGGDGGAHGESAGGGGGGAGGTVRLLASVLTANKIDVAGGSGGLAGAPQSYGSVGADGQYAYGTNAANGSIGIVAGDATPRTEVGRRDANPYVRVQAAMQATPFIPDLPAVGAEIYGLSDLTPDDLDLSLGGLPSTDVNGTPLAGAIAALIRVSFADHHYAGGLTDEFTGFDLLAFVNLSSAGLEQPSLWNGHNAFVPLQSRGWAENPFFGGDGEDAIAYLAAENVWVTLTPQLSDYAQYWSIRGNGAGSLFGKLNGHGDVLYLNTVPEPSGIALVLAGLAGLARIGRKRAH